MAHDNSRGAIYDPEADTTLDMGTLIDEDVSLKAGILRVPIPLLSAGDAAFESVFGRTRVISLRGYKRGTQEQIETFLGQFTTRVDKDGFQKSFYYYPLFHPDNTAGNGSQDKYYNIMINDFSVRVELTTAGFVVMYDLELFEGSRVKTYLSGS